MPEPSLLARRVTRLASRARWLAVCAGLALASPGSTAWAATLHPDGQWLKDAKGRVVIIHGLQVAHKTAPYFPPPASFSDVDGALISSWGFNAVRLGWFWVGLEPTRGQIDTTYLNEIVREGQVLSDHHIYTLLEAHQDIYGPALGGDGFPGWATLTDGVPILPHSALDIEAPATDRAFDNLYANADGIGAEFAHAWSVMANAFRSNPLMLGYDLFNEPYPGSHDPTCMQPAGCPAFDTASLEPFETRLAMAVRAADPRPPVFYEPHIYFDFGVGSWLARPPSGVGPAGFAFHDYCLAPIFTGQPDQESSAPGYQSCPTEDEHVMQNAASTAAAMHAPSLLDEFGDTQDLANIERMVQLADSHMEGWLYWSYKDWIDAPGGVGSGALFDDSDNNATLRRAKLAVLSEPYPQATSGTPLSYGYDPASNTFTYTYKPNAAIRAPTIVFVPELHYPNGYRVEVTGARVVSPAGASHLELASEPQATRVRLVVTSPAGP